MDATVFAAVLAAALMHAGWNAVVKVGLDRFFVPVPAPASWPWLAASALLHTGYKLFLIRAYEHGDLGQVYPLARGTARSSSPSSAPRSSAKRPRRPRRWPWPRSASAAS